jgi:hypothetical protein
VTGTGLSSDAICARLRAEHGVLASDFGPSVRMVTHYDVNRADIERALEGVRKIISHR